MHWELALEFASKQKDVTYEEWCSLYVPRQPTDEDIEKALVAAMPILIRNRVVADNANLSWFSRS